MASYLRAQFDQAAKCAAKVPVVDLVAVLSATVLLRNAHGGWYTVQSAAVLAITLVSRGCRRSPFFWWGIALTWLPRLYFDWYHNEDHIYVGVYWIVAFGLALAGTNQETILARSARILIGLSFGIAVIWKIFVPQFVDASLFHYKLLYDYRFRQLVTQPIGGLSDAQNAWNHTASAQLTSDEYDPPIADLQYPRGVTRIAVVMTVWTIAIEGLLAAVFLLPPSIWTNRFRDPTLIVFLLTTYFVAPVMGFASVFTTLGIAQAPRDQGYTRVAYGATLALLTVWFSVAF